MEKNSQATDMQELALVLMNLPEKARERICYMIEGALLVQEPSASELTSLESASPAPITAPGR